MRKQYVTLVVSLIGILSFVLPTSAVAASIAQSYRSNGGITNGSLVSILPGSSDTIQLANVSNAAYLLGVATQPNNASISIGSNTNSTQVVTSGNTVVAVSAFNGNIKAGDQISVSPLSGYGMKAETGLAIIGVAETDFNNHSPGTTMRKIMSKKSQTDQVAVGFVRLSLDIKTAPNNNSGGNGLQLFVARLTGHEVSTARIVVSLLVVSIALISLITLIYASIYGSIMAIGRNPLAKYTVLRNLRLVLIMALLTSVITGLILVLLLR
jgi:hypothetical protein